MTPYHIRVGIRFARCFQTHNSCLHLKNGIRNISNNKIATHYLYGELVCRVILHRTVVYLPYRSAKKPEMERAILSTQFIEMEKNCGGSSLHQQ